MRFFKKNALGQYIILKRLLLTLVGAFTWPRFVLYNRVVVAGMSVLRNLPSKNVLFVSNHQTYFADVMLMYHVFSAAKWGLRRGISNPVYLLSPKVNTFYVAASETMKSGFLPKLFAYGGAVQVQRTWREAGQNIQREVKTEDTQNIAKVLKKSWLITFPQGTTTPFEKGRKGTAHIIKQHRPLVVPVNINGFRRAFDKKGLKLKKRDVTLKVRFYDPLDIDYDASVDDILESVMYSIKQTGEFLNVTPLEQERGK